jgi:hypothetical protein
MKIQFTVMITGKGPTVEKAYQDMRRKLLPMVGWADTDEAFDITAEGDFEDVPEADVQRARKAFPFSRDGRRLCNGGPTCLHDVIVYGIPACMMSDKETRKMVKRGHRITRGQDKSS